MKLIILYTLFLLLASLAQAKIAKGDTLTIVIKGVPQSEQAQINGIYEVSRESKIALPFLKELSVSGLTTSKLARRIETEYRNAEIYTTPNISIQSKNEQDELARTLAKKTNEKIETYLTVSGKVGRPGPQAYRPGLKLIDVVSASVPTTFAALNRVELLRNGKIYKYDMDVSAHKLEKVYANDQINVKEKNWRGR